MALGKLSGYVSAISTHRNLLSNHLYLTVDSARHSLGNSFSSPGNISSVSSSFVAPTSVAITYNPRALASSTTVGILLTNSQEEVTGVHDIHQLVLVSNRSRGRPICVGETLSPANLRQSESPQGRELKEGRPLKPRIPWQGPFRPTIKKRISFVFRADLGVSEQKSSTALDNDNLFLCCTVGNRDLTQPAAERNSFPRLTNLFGKQWAHHPLHFFLSRKRMVETCSIHGFTRTLGCSLKHVLSPWA